MLTTTLTRVAWVAAGVLLAAGTAGAQPIPTTGGTPTVPAKSGGLGSPGSSGYGKLGVPSGAGTNTGTTGGTAAGTIPSLGGTSGGAGFGGTAGTGSGLGLARLCNRIALLRRARSNSPVFGVPSLNKTQFYCKALALPRLSPELELQVLMEAMVIVQALAQDMTFASEFDALLLFLWVYEMRYVAVVQEALAASGGAGAGGLPTGP